MLHSEKSTYNVAPPAPSRDEGALGTYRFILAALQHKTRGEDALPKEMNHIQMVPNKPLLQESLLPLVLLRHCFAPSWGREPCPEGYGGLATPPRSWLSFQRNRGRFCTVAAGAEDNEPRSDGRVKRDLFRCQGQKALPKSSVRK